MTCTCEIERQERKRSRQLECYKERQVWSCEGGEEQPRVSSLWSHLRPWWNPSLYSFWGPCLSPWPYSIVGLCWWDDHCPCYHQGPGRCPRPEQLPGTTLISKGFTELALSSLAIAPVRAGPSLHLLQHSREQEQGCTLSRQHNRVGPHSRGMDELSLRAWELESWSPSSMQRYG